MIDTTVQLKMFLSTFVMQLPSLLVCLAAGVVLLVRWRQAPGASLWALLGFGLAALLGLIIPVVQSTVQYWLMNRGDMARHAAIFGALAMVWSVLRALTYVLLLVAVFTDRPAQATPPPVTGGQG
jgi:hypothetical protein